MDHRQLALLLAFVAPLAHAGYANLAPPPGWSGGTSVPTYKAAANELWTSAATVRTDASLAVAGRSVAMPVAMRLSAANAPRMLAATIGRGMLGGPIGIASIAVTLALPAVKSWYEQSAYKFNFDTLSWEEKLSGATCTAEFNGKYGTADSCEAAGVIAVKAYSPSWTDATVRCEPPPYATLCYAYAGSTSNSFGRVYMTATTGQTGTKPADYATQVEPQLRNIPVPPSLPQNLPDLPWPVEDPVMNPEPDPVGAPVANPAARPAVVPTGDPAPVPNSNPATQSQPVVRVTQSPTTAEPWRVNVIPEQVTSPVGTAPVADPKQTTTPAPSSTPTDKPPGLCDQYPDIVACMKSDQPEEKDIERKDKELTITPDSGWGADNAACPQPRKLYGGGVPGGVELSFQPICDVASGLRPIIIATAWLSAATMLLLSLRK